MVRGPKPKAPRLKIAGGTRGRVKVDLAAAANGAERKLEASPKCPKLKRETFSKWWKHYTAEMAAVGALTARDLAAVEQLCDAHQDIADAIDAMDAAAKYVQTMHGIIRHPAYITIEKAREFILKSQLNLGFTPAGRARVPAAVADSQNRGVQGLNRKA